MRAPGLLTGADGSAEALAEVRADNLDHFEATDPDALRQCIAWQTRDLDRLKRLDSDEVTTW